MEAIATIKWVLVGVAILYALGGILFIIISTAKAKKATKAKKDEIREAIKNGTYEDLEKIEGGINEDSTDKQEDGGD